MVNIQKRLNTAVTGGVKLEGGDALVGSILTGINVCVFQEYRSDETTAEGVMEGRKTHMFSSRTYRRTGKGERLLLL